MSKALSHFMSVNRAKIAPRFTIIMYASREQADDWHRAIASARWAQDMKFNKDRAEVLIQRYNTRFQQLSRSYAVVVSNSFKTPPPSALHYHLRLPLNKELETKTTRRSVISRNDLTWTNDQGTTRTRAVDEFRHFVREYSTPKSWVVAMGFDGDGAAMLGALTEGRNVVGVESGPMGPISWRLDLFQLIEHGLHDRLTTKSLTDQDGGETAPGATLMEDDSFIQQLHIDTPMEATDKDKELVAQKIRIWCARRAEDPDYRELTEEEMKSLIGQALELHNSAKAIRDLLLPRRVDAWVTNAYNNIVESGPLP